MATINHERKRVITNVIRFREDSKRRPHDFNIGKLDETLGEKKSSGQGWPLVRKMGVPRKRIVNPRWCRVRRRMHQINRVNPVFRVRGGHGASGRQ
jgi:hypothetical protein